MGSRFKISNIVGSCSGLLAGLLLLPAIGHASERVSAATCFIDTDNMGDYRWNGDGIANHSSGLGWRPRTAYCPITVADEFARKSDISSVRVSLVDGNNQFGAVHNFHVRVCLTPWNTGLAATCSATRELNPGTTTGAAWLAIPADLRDFLNDPARPFHYANLFVTIPANNGWPSVLRGYEVFR